MAVLFVRLDLYNSPAGLGLWVAHTLLAIPFAFFVLRTGFRRIPVELEEAAQLDGATRLGAVLRVTLPLARPSLAAAALLVFLVSWDEFAYALAPAGHQPAAAAAALLLRRLRLSRHGERASRRSCWCRRWSSSPLLAPAIRAGALRGSGR